MRDDLKQAGKIVGAAFDVVYHLLTDFALAAFLLTLGLASWLGFLHAPDGIRVLFTGIGLAGWFVALLHMCARLPTTVREWDRALERDTGPMSRFMAGFTAVVVLVVLMGSITATFILPFLDIVQRLEALTAAMTTVIESGTR